MKKFITTIILLLPIAALAQKGFTISGKINMQHEPVMVFLDHTDVNDRRFTDSSVVKNGTFSFKGSAIEPHTAILAVRYKGDGHRLKDVLSFYIENTNISVIADDSIRKAKVTGSKINDDDQDVKASLRPLIHHNVSLNYELGRAERKDPEVKKEPWYLAKADTLKKLQAEIKALKIKYIETHRASYYALSAFDQWIVAPGQTDSKELNRIFSGFSSELKPTLLYQHIAITLSLLSKRQIGRPVPDFLQPDIDGKPFKLSSLRGKYVLLDFWASWCVPCRAENPNVVKAYHELKDKNFEVVSISLDTNHDAWINAIQKDGMPWIHVSDLKGFKNELALQFNITSIPQNYLIDPNGVMIATNLRGEDLDKQLAVFIK